VTSPVVQPILELLPLALGIAASPLAVMVVIVMLVAPGGRLAAAVYVLGWLGGLLVVGGLTLAFVDVTTGASPDDTGWVGPVIRLGLGVVLLLLALREWRGRPRPGDVPALPAWMASLEGARPRRAFVLGVTLASVKPKNLVLAAAAGAAIAGAELPVGQSVAVLVLFAVVASVSVAAPLLAVLAVGPRAGAMLAGWRAWLEANNAVLVAVVLLVLGAVLLVQGIAALA
jgi:threonine/homoserine/homoserine lactone efflux protein